MSVLLSHGAKLGGRLLAEIIIVLAILLSLSRLVLPFANEFREVMAGQIEKIIHHPVVIGHVEADWAGFKPLIKLRNVKIGADASGAPLAVFEMIRLKINPWLSLARGALVPDRLILRGSVVEIVRGKDGRLLFRGFEPPGMHSQRRFGSLEDLAGLTLALRDIRVKWDDQALARKFRFVARKLDMVIGAASVDLDAHLNLPFGQGENLRLVARARGPLNDVFSWRNEFYLKGSSVDVRANPLGWPAGWAMLANGRLNFEIWGSWKPEGTVEALGEIAAYGLRIADADLRKELAVREVSSRFHLSGTARQWRLDLDRLGVKTGRERWPVRAASLAWRAGERPSIEGFIDRLDMGELAMLADRMPGLAARYRELAIRLRPEGRVRDLRFRVADEGAKGRRYMLAAAFEQLGWRAFRRWPGIQQLSGNVRLDENGGEARLRGRALMLDLPKLLGHGLALKRLSADAQWRRDGREWRAVIDNLKLATADFGASGTARLALAPGKKPVLDMELIVPRADSRKAPDYIPFPIIRNPHVRDLLRKGFVGGEVRNARIGFHGALDKQAFRSGRSHLRARFDVANGQFHYHDGWPDARELNGNVLFSDVGFEARVNSGRILNTRISPATLTIANLFRSRLDIDGKARGDLSDIIRFLHDTPLVRNMTELLAQVKSQGRTSLDLSLKLPLGKALKRRGDKPVFDGHVLLKDALLALPRQKVRFEAISGALAFSDKAWNATGLTARFRGSPVTGRVDTSASGDIRIGVQGDFEAADLLPNLRRQLALALPGRTLWRGALVVPSRGRRQQGVKTKLLVRSDLEGVEVALPPPLEKPAQQPGALSVQYDFAKPAHLLIDYGQALRFEGDLKTGGDGRVSGMARGVARLLDSDAPMPETGLLVAGDWPGIELGPWLDALDRLRDPDGERLRPIRLDAGFGYLAIGNGLTLNHVRVSGRLDYAQWVMDVAADQGKGTLKIPSQADGRHIVANLTRLDLPVNRGNEGRSSLSPLDLPAVDATVDALRIGARSLGKLHLRTTRASGGLRIDNLDLDQPHLRARASGGWLQLGGRQRLDLDIDVSSDDVGAALKDLGIRQSLRRGHGDLMGKLHWDGPLLPLDLARLSGKLDLQISEGKLSNVEPGLGRLISLISLDNLPRRLALDFADVSDTGFSFDLLSGSVSVNQGELTVGDLEMSSPLADIDIGGSTDLKRMRHHLRFGVTPKIKSSVPVAAGLLAGPQTGAAVFLFNKLAESMGVDFNRSARLEYSITGDWRDPLIAPLREDDGDPEDAAPFVTVPAK